MEGAGRGDARSGGAWELGAGRAVVGQDAGDARSGGAWGGALAAQCWGAGRGDARAKGEHFSIFCPSFLLI